MEQESLVRRLGHLAFVIYLSLVYLFETTSSKSLTSNICKSKECMDTASNLTLWMNVSVDPCDDFYLYACGNYKKRSDLLNSNDFQRTKPDFFEVWDFLKKNDSDDEPEAVHKARKLHNICVNMRIIKPMLKHLNIPSLTSEDYEVLNEDLKYGQQQVPFSSCIYFVKSKLYLAISYMYTQMEKYRNGNIQVNEMLKYIRKTFTKIIEQATWMDARTKKKTLRKLVFMRHYFSYPAEGDELRELLEQLYSDVDIDENYNPLETMSKIQDILNFNEEKAMKEHDNNPSKKINKFSFLNSLVKNTLYYKPKLNLIGIPNSAIEPPLYGNGIKAMDFGGIGKQLAHEMLHAFGPESRTLNEWGIEENWWSETSSRIYNEKLKCYNVSVEGNANKESSLPMVPTINEDFSDHEGFHLALSAYRNYVSEKGEKQRLVNFENLTHEQLFTLGFAFNYCQYPLSNAYIRKPTDPHGSDEARVNGVLRNSKEFAEIWKCPKGSKMNPSAKCSLIF